MDKNKKEVVFADGFIFKKPRPEAPSFVKGSLSIKTAEAIAFIQRHSVNSEWVNLDLKQSKEGKLYLQLNTYKKPNS